MADKTRDDHQQGSDHLARSTSQGAGVSSAGDQIAFDPPGGKSVRIEPRGSEAFSSGSMN